MGIGDLFKAKKNQELETRVAELESLLTPELRDYQTLQQKLATIKQEVEQAERNKETELAYIDRIILEKSSALKSTIQKLDDAKKALVETDESVLMQSFGLYTPRFCFANATGYKEALDEVRTKQKDMLKVGSAATGNSNWTVNVSAQKGQKMVRDMQKLLLRAFNCECDDVVEHVKFNNIDASEKRIRTAHTTISKLGVTYGVSITEAYLKLKIKELYLAHEFQVKKQEEKEHLKQLRAEERERVKLEKEIEEARKKIDKEQKHYSNALAKINQQIESATPDELAVLEAKREELKEQLKELEESKKQVDYRAASQRAGYVYIISNIGAFGENIYKIGMTRRLEPMDRIDELGDASVPFDFDVHALIFSDDAPALETALHHAFEDRKLTMINTRREFFQVTLDEIKEVIRAHYDKTVEFIDVPPAEQFRESMQLRKKCDTRTPCVLS